MKSLGPEIYKQLNGKVDAFVAGEEQVELFQVEVFKTKNKNVNFSSRPQRFNFKRLNKYW